jgi:signal transduction histidine kinase
VAEVAAGLLLCRQAALPFVRASVAGTSSACGVGALDRGLVELLIQLTRQTLAARPERNEHEAIVEERQRLARELHDSVAQSLYTVTLYADAAGLALAAHEPEHIREHLHDLRQTAQEALRDMRLIIFDLRPSELQPGGLPEAVAHRLEVVEAHVGLQTHITCEGQGPLPFLVEEELYRIIQEALNNVIKHAQATRVEVKLSFGPNEASLEISDDGLGFNPDQPAVHRGLGLDDMAARAQRIGARMEISSGPARAPRCGCAFPASRSRLTGN